MHMAVFVCVVVMRFSRFVIMHNYSFVFLSRSEFVTTVTLSNAIIAPATAGLKVQPKNGKRTPAATGMPTELYPNDQIRFCHIVLLVFLARLTASAILPMSPLRSTMSELSMAMSEPSLIEIATSACASAGESFTPSPIIATLMPFFCKSPLILISPAALHRYTPDQYRVPWQRLLRFFCDRR